MYSAKCPVLKNGKGILQWTFVCAIVEKTERMMFMKKWIAMLLVLVMVLSLAACGKEAPAGKVEAAPETTETADAGKPVTLGRIEGGVYTNDYIGIGCELDSTWTFYTAEELQELPNQVGELMQDTEYADAHLRQITDMMAENVDAMVNMNVQYTKMTLQERLAYLKMNDEALVDMILEDRDSMAAAYAQAGIEDAILEKTTVNFLGQERCAIRTVATIQGYPYYMLQVFEYGLGQYGVTITFSSFFEDNTTSMLDLFYALD